MKVPFVIYANMGSFLGKIPTCNNNPEDSFTSKTNKHAMCGYSLFIQCSFNNNNKGKQDIYRGEDSMKRFYRDLRWRTTEIVNCKRRKCCCGQRKTKNHTRNGNSVIYSKKNSIKHLVKNLMKTKIIKKLPNILTKFDKDLAKRFETPTDSVAETLKNFV